MKLLGKIFGRGQEASIDGDHVPKGQNPQGKSREPTVVVHDAGLSRLTTFWKPPDGIVIIHHKKPTSNSDS